MLNNLKKLRSEQKVSQSALGEIIGVTQQAVNRYENHDVEPDIETLIKIADYFNVSVDYLIGNTTERHKCEEVKEYDLNKEEQHFIDSIRQIKGTERQSIKLLLDYIARK